MRPIDAKTDKQICKLRRDNLSTKEFWILLGEGEVTLAKQRNLAPAEVMLKIPRAQFDRLVRWYVTGKASK